MRYRSTSRGFTLIELLVAIGILAIVAVLGWRGLDSIVRSRDVLTAELEQTRGLQLTFAQLQSDCSQNANPLSYPNMPEGRSSWIEPQRLILIRHEYVDDQAPSMQVVVYRLKDANLMRFESLPTRDLEVLKQLLDQARNPPANQVEVVMQKNIQDFQFAGYPENTLIANTNPTEEPNTPPAADGTKNPPENSETKPDGQKPEGQKTPDKQSDKQSETDNLQKVNQASVTTGLQVSLQLQKRDKKIVKIFMLGGA